MKPIYRHIVRHFTSQNRSFDTQSISQVKIRTTGSTCLSLNQSLPKQEHLVRKGLGNMISLYGSNKIPMYYFSTSSGNDSNENTGEHHGLTNEADIDKNTIDHLNSSEFMTARLSDTFVDKTELILEILKMDPTKVNIITGPRRWGKTTNLRMLEAFFDINQTHYSRLVDPLKNSNRELFKGTKIFESPVFNEHFGRYPVIYMQFANINVSSCQSIIEGLYGQAEDVDEKYQYLLDDPTIKGRYEKISNKLQKEKTFDNLRSYLLSLCKLLKKIYNKNPIILIDEADEPARRILAKHPDPIEFEKSVQIFKDFNISFFKMNPNKSYSILTGITRLANCKVFSPIPIKEFMIVTGDLAKYYSFTSDEVENMLNSLPYTKNFAKEYTDIISKMYNGYKFGKTTIYNCYSVVEALKELKQIEGINDKKIEEQDITKVFQPYWAESHSLRMLTETFTNWRFFILLKLLLERKDVTSRLMFLNSPEDALRGYAHMYKYINNPYINDADFIDEINDIMLSYMFVSGYLTGDRNEDNIYTVKIPNDEIWNNIKDFSSRIEDNLKSTIEINNLEIEEIQTLFKQITKLDENELKAPMRRIFELMCKNILYLMINSFSIKGFYDVGIKINEVMFHHAVYKCIPTCDSEYTNGWERVIPGNKGIVDIYYIDIKEQTLVIIELKYNNKAEKAYDQAEEYCKYFDKINENFEIMKVIRLGVGLKKKEDTFMISYKYSVNPVTDKVIELNPNSHSDIVENTISGK